MSDVLYKNQRRLNLSSTDILTYNDNASGDFILHYPVIPEDDCHLLYALNEFSFDTTAYNISSLQENNSLVIKYEYSDCPYEVTRVVVDPVTGDVTLEIKDKAGYNADQVFAKYFYLELPDGNYKNDTELFEALSNDLYYYIDSGIRVNFKNTSVPVFNPETTNDILIHLTWTKINAGFNISMVFDEDEINVEYNCNYDDGNGNIIPMQRIFAELMPIPLKIFIYPNPSKPKLYTLLFTNTKNNNEGQPPTTPIPVGNTFKNPPEFVGFNIFTDGIIPVGTKVLNMNDYFRYQSIVEDGGALDKYKTLNIGVLPNSFTYNDMLNFINYPITIFNHFTLSPVYIDIKTNLITKNVSSEGENSTLLKRIPLIGADNGNTSFIYQPFNLVFHMLPINASIDSVKIHLSSEGDKWSFYNVKFNFELIIQEISDSQLQVQKDKERQLVLPSSDIISETVLNTYKGSSKRKHYR